MQYAHVAVESKVGEIMAPVEFPSRSDKSQLWNVCAALVVLGLTLSTVVQDSFHRSYLNSAAPGVPIDFPHYYLAGRLARLKPPENLLYYPPIGYAARSYVDLRTDGTTPYGRPSPGTGLPAKYYTGPFDAPPFSAVLMEPLASLPWQKAYLVWQLLCVVMMVGSLYIAFRIPHDQPPSTLLMAVGVALALLYLPFKRSLSFGNIDVFVLLMWAAGILLLRRGQISASACCFALGTAIKVNPIFALPVLVMRRQWRWLASYGVASATLLAVSVWKLGWQNHVLWAGKVAPALSCGIKSFWNRSLASFIFGLGQPRDLLMDLPGLPSLCVFTKVISLVCYIAFLVWCWRQRRDSKGMVFEILLVPLVILLVSPLSWTYHYVLALIPLIYLWSRSREKAAAASKLDLILLTVSTLIIGSALPDYVAAAVGTYGQLLVMGAWVAATVALIWVGMRMYGGCVTRPLETAADPS